MAVSFSKENLNVPLSASSLGAHLRRDSHRPPIRSGSSRQFRSRTWRPLPLGNGLRLDPGLALTVPPGWIQLPRGKFLPHTLAFGTRPTGLNYYLRLVIAPFAVTSLGNDTHAARLTAGKLIQANRVPSARQTAVNYAGTRGVLVRGLPGGPGPAADIFLARNGHVYQIIAPGASLAPDQRRALASLRFIPRSGNFLPPVGGGR